MVQHADLDHSAVAGIAFAGVRVTHSTTQTIGDSAHTALTFDTESFDTDGFHSTVTNTSRLTVPAGKGGKYMIGAGAGIEANATGTRQLRLRLNGTTYIGGHANWLGTSSVSFRNNISTLYQLADGDYIEVTLWQNSGANRVTVNADGLPALWMFRVGD